MNKFIPVIIVLLLLLCGNVKAEHLQIENYDINMKIQENGDILVEEIINYDLIGSGQVKAVRNINKNSFSNVKFIALKGESDIFQKEIINSKDSLKLKWIFPINRDKTKFRILYKIKGGIKELEDTNYIYIPVIGENGHNEIKNFKVKLYFPRQPVIKNIKTDDCIVKDEKNIIEFQKSVIPPEGRFTVEIETDKIIETKSLENIWVFIVAGAGLGVLLNIFDIFKVKNKLSGNINKKTLDSDLNYQEKGAVFFWDSSQEWRINLAYLLSMGIKGNIIIKIKKENKERKKLKYKVNISSKAREQQITGENKFLDIIEKTKDKYLNIDEIVEIFKEKNSYLKPELIEKGIISKENIILKKKLQYSFVVLFISAAFVLGLAYSLLSSLLFGLSLFLLTTAMFRIIKKSIISELTNKGIYLQNKIKEDLQEILNVFEMRLERAPTTAYYYLLKNIPSFIILSGLQKLPLKKYKEKFLDLKYIKLPYFIQLKKNKVKQKEKLKIVILFIENVLDGQNQ
ncbi:MAG: DUF2207 domain-containing protein [Halanaerobiales bacterium]